MRALIPLCLLSALMAKADTLFLRNGSPVNGTFVSGTSQSIKFLPDGGRAENYPISQVDRISFGDSSRSSSSRGYDRDNRDRDDRDRNDRERDLRDRENRDRNSRDNRNQSVSGSRDDEAPSGTNVVVRMIDSINSNATDAGKTYRASLDQDVTVNGRVIAPRGSDAVVQVMRVEQGRAIGGREEVGLQLTEIMANGRRLRPVTQDAQITANSRGSQNVKVIGGTAALGAIIGAIAGGGKGAAIGAASGAGAGTAVQAIRGQKIEVPSETQLTFTLSEPLRN